VICQPRGQVEICPDAVELDILPRSRRPQESRSVVSKCPSQTLRLPSRFPPTDMHRLDAAVTDKINMAN